MLATKLRGGTIVYFISGLTGADAVSEVTKMIYRQALFGIGGIIFPPFFLL